MQKHLVIPWCFPGEYLFTDCLFCGAKISFSLSKGHADAQENARGFHGFQLSAAGFSWRTPGAFLEDSLYFPGGSVRCVAPGFPLVFSWGKPGGVVPPGEYQGKTRGKAGELCFLSLHGKHQGKTMIQGFPLEVSIPGLMLRIPPVRFARRVEFL